MNCAQLLLFIAPTLAADGDSLRVFPPDADGPPAQQLVYQHLQRAAHAALDKRLAEYEALQSEADIRAYQQRRRDFFIQQLGGFPERSPLDSQIVGKLDGDGYTIEKVIFLSQPRHHITANLYLPDTPPPYPGVVVASGHSRTAKTADYNQRFGIIMARHGMAALCYDPIGQGERSQILTAAGKAKHRSTTREHFQVGVGAILVGTNTASYRTYDGMRAIDYLVSRDDIRADRIGFTGCSGGGTLTSYVMALDDRVACAAPACYLTTFRRLIDTIGPQDAEQNIFGQIAFGMDHPDYVLMRAPRPTIISSTTDDYFDIDGAWNNYRQAKRIYNRLGYPERVDLVEGPGGHGVPMLNLIAITRWMRRWLLEKDDAITNGEIQVRSESELLCTPSGQLLHEDDELSVFDLNSARQKLLAGPRAAAWNRLGTRERRNLVRKVASIRSLASFEQPSVQPAGRVLRDGYRIDKLILALPGGVSLPALAFVPPKADSESYLYLNGRGKQIDADAGGKIETIVKQGHLVLAVDLSSIGELQGERANEDLGDWRNFYLAYLLGQSMVGIRTNEILQCATWLRDHDFGDRQPKRRVHLRALGEAAIPALHAAAVESDLFASIELQPTIRSWVDVVEAGETKNQLTNAIHGVLRHYDLPDLRQLADQATQN